MWLRRKFGEKEMKPDFTETVSILTVNAVGEGYLYGFLDKRHSNCGCFLGLLFCQI
jgi:hypothetical protein